MARLPSSLAAAPVPAACPSLEQGQAEGDLVAEAIIALGDIDSEALIDEGQRSKMRLAIGNLTKALVLNKKMMGTKKYTSESCTSYSSDAISYAVGAAKSKCLQAGHSVCTVRSESMAGGYFTLMGSSKLVYCYAYAFATATGEY
jgi:hypothetical protein